MSRTQSIASCRLSCHAASDLTLKISDKYQAFSCLVCHLQKFWLPGGNSFCCSDCDRMSFLKLPTLKMSVRCTLHRGASLQPKSANIDRIPMHCKQNGRPKISLQTLPRSTIPRPLRQITTQLDTYYKNYIAINSTMMYEHKLTRKGSSREIRIRFSELQQEKLV